MSGEKQPYSVKYYRGVTAKKVEWLWYPYIPYGKITIIQGDPGEGKSTVAINLASIISMGKPCRWKKKRPHQQRSSIRIAKMGRKTLLCLA